jgi:hypothetical protein
MTGGVIFLAVVCLLLALCGLAFVHVGALRFHSRLGRAHDGFEPGATAPTWRERDTDGAVHEVPSRSYWQLLVFADHALVRFPSVVEELRHMATDPRREVILLPSRAAEVVLPTFRSLDLRIPVVPVTSRFWHDHNVHASPFVLVLDEEGVVQINSLVSEGSQLRHLWRLALGGSASQSTSPEATVT